MPRFITLTEVYEQLMSESSSLRKDAAVLTEGAQGVMRLRNNAMVDIFVTESDIKEHAKFAETMAIQDRSQKFHALEALILDIMKERVNLCDTLHGVRIATEFSFKDVIPYRITVAKLIQDAELAKSESLEDSQGVV